MKTIPQSKIEKLKENLRFGIEIECITSKHIDKADYHANYGDGSCDENCDEDCDGDHEGECKQYYGQYFYAECDGSLQFNPENRYRYYGICDLEKLGFSRQESGTVELISDIPFRYDRLEPMLDALKQDLDRRGVKIGFNSSCGSHVHVSYKGQLLQKLFGIDQIFGMRREIFKGMRKLFNDDAKFDLWKAYYFRYFAKRVSRKDEKKRDRYCEVNRTLDNRIEVRSTHLMGITNFEDMKKAYKIFFDAIIYALSYKPITDKSSIEFTTLKRDIEETNRQFRIDTDNTDIRYVLGGE